MCVLTTWNKALAHRINIIHTMMMMIDVLRPLLCIWQAKWAERPPRVMKQSENESPFRYVHAEIRTRVVVICGPTLISASRSYLRTEGQYYSVVARVGGNWKQGHVFVLR